MTSIPDITLNNGQSIPQLGFGVFLIEPKDTADAVSTALQAGYRHIDTAQMYGNEAEVGEAIAKSGLDRGEVFVTSKLGNGAHEPRARVPHRRGRALACPAPRAAAARKSGASLDTTNKEESIWSGSQPRRFPFTGEHEGRYERLAEFR